MSGCGSDAERASQNRTSGSWRGRLASSGFQLDRGDESEGHPARAVRVGPSRWLWPVGRFTPDREVAPASTQFVAGAVSWLSIGSPRRSTTLPLRGRPGSARTSTRWPTRTSRDAGILLNMGHVATAYRWMVLNDRHWERLILSRFNVREIRAKLDLPAAGEGCG
jgi:hypothetical protein